VRATISQAAVCLLGAWNDCGLASVCTATTSRPGSVKFAKSLGSRFGWNPNHLPVAPTPGGDGTLRKPGRFSTAGRAFLWH